MKSSYAWLAGLSIVWIAVLLMLRDSIDLSIVLLAACSILGIVLIASEGLRKPQARIKPLSRAWPR